MGRLDDPHTEGRLLLLAGDLLALVMMTAGTALAFLSGYQIHVEPGAVLAFCVLAAVVSAVLHSLSRPWWSVGAAAVVALVFWWTWKEVFPVLQDIGRKMGLLSGAGAVWSSRQEEWILPAVLLLCAALAWLMGWAAVRLRAWYLAALLCAAPLLPAIQGGTLPAWGAMLAAFAGWGSLLLTALYGRKDPGSLGRARLWSLAGMAALVVTLVMALPMEGYLRPQWATDARDSLILGVRRQLERRFDLASMDGGFLADLGLDLSVSVQGGDAVDDGGTVWDGGARRREDLLAAGPRRYAERMILSVETDEPDSAGRVYLRGWSLGTYTGESWEMLEESGPWFSGEEGRWPSLYPGLTAVDGTACTMTVRDRSGRLTGFYPYRLTAESRTDEAGLLYLPEEVSLLREKTYQVPYIPGGPETGFAPLEGSLAEEEFYYRSAVPYSLYLTVPPGAWETLGPLLTEIQAGGEEDPTLPEPFRATLSAASNTARALAERAVYDLDVPAMEPGEDFTAHFLEEGRGYCVHFATAGTLLLRMQGIPARYVTGYTVGLDFLGRGVALDSDAHAWVEVYLDGYGWYPVEMTPGYTGGPGSGALPEDPLPEEPEGPDRPDGPEASPEEDEELPEEDPALPLPIGEDGPAGPSLFAGVLRAAGRTGAVLCALGGLYALALLPRRLARRERDTNRSVIRAYGRYRRVLGLGGVEDGTLEALGRKAAFSQHTLTEEEREDAWRRLDEAALAAQKRQKKYLRWLFVLLRPAL